MGFANFQFLGKLYWFWLVNFPFSLWIVPTSSRGELGIAELW